MIREILTEWRPATIAAPMRGDLSPRLARMEGQLDHNVQARIVRVEHANPDRLDDDDQPVKTSHLAVEHKVVSEADSHVHLIKEHNTKEHRWAKKRFALQFEELAGRTLGQGRIGTPLISSGVVPEGILPAFLKEGVNTVEQLAYMSDANLAKFGPGMSQWRDRAQDWLNAQDRKSVQPTVDNSDDAMSAAVGETGKGKKRGPGRPPKDQPTAA